jgi:ribonuclease P protein component
VPHALLLNVCFFAPFDPGWILKMNQIYRLRRSEDFQIVRRDGQFYASPLLVLAFLRNDLTHSRFGYVVNRRLGKAVHRNKIKRRMREATRLRLPTIKEGFDLVLIARKPITKAAYAEVEKTVVGLLKRAKLIRN